ncbi:FAD-dependent monooxygenase [Nonomuraea sp. NPDC050556]|uniref:FAD-dependent monooxygenase n=1 Tax=Nonomuraea sp. NPDC050556 TaxID=3364369 RepID=UPI0037B386E4
MTNVLIVGSGPTGLTLAIELARRGVDFRIVERSPEHPRGSRGKGLQPRTLEIFHDLGVVDEILATGAVYPAIRSYVGDQMVWEGRMHEPKEPTEDVPYPMVIMQPQWRIERILRERLAELGHHVELGTEVIDFEQDDDGVTVTLSNGTVKCDYLVGADGGRSTVRKRLGVGFHGDTFESERMLLGDVKTDDVDREYWRVYVDPETQQMAFGLCPLPGTDVFQFTSLVTDETDFQKIVSRYSDITLKEVTWRSEYRVNIRMAERFRVGRVFLAGDAAHVHSPAGGQGMNTGIQDAYNLGWKLASGDERLIGTYEAERMPIAEHVLGLSTRLLREGDLKRDEETQQLNLGYWESPLSVGERGGERMPGLWGGHFTLHGDLLIRPDGYIGFDGPASKLDAYLSGFGISRADVR